MVAVGADNRRVVQLTFAEKRVLNVHGLAALDAVSE
jgi:hypothetical protein